MILKFLPAILQRKIEHRRGLLRILDNIGWLFFDKIFRMIVGLIVGIWVARYLGPIKFGLLSYSIAFVTLFDSVASVGFSTGIIVRDLVQYPSVADTTMGTAFAMLFSGGICAFGLALFSVRYVRPDDLMAIFAVTLLAFRLVFRATDVVKFWFESQVQSKYVVWTENGIILLFTTVRIFLIVSNATFMAFIWTLFAEGLLLAVGLIGVYVWVGGKISAWKLSFTRAGDLLKDSWPLILTGIAYMVYMRIDQIMLGHILGDGSVGIYTAAVTISEALYFIPMTITASVFPTIIEAKKNNEAIYSLRIQQLFDLMNVLALAVAIPMTFLSDSIISLLFGPEYQRAGTVLAVHVWAGIFYFLMAAGGKWFLIEGLQRYSFYRALFGAIVNIGLNLILIPKLEILGAAIATIISLAWASMLFNLFSNKTRPIFFMQCKSFLSTFRFLITFTKLKQI
ncbi:MAG: O-unit flippase [Deltaproteobacteria bacterium]|nr:MAG: O-unit flippase [Deltaproteobacteria bacterium]